MNILLLVAHGSRREESNIEVEVSRQGWPEHSAVEDE